MKSLSKIIPIALLGVFIIALSSCSKDPGFDGKKTILGTVTYDGTAVAGAEVYLAIDVTEAVETYDYVTLTDETGAYSFESLNKGSYYIDASYTDQHGFEYNSPGALITVEDKKTDLTVDLELH